MKEISSITNAELKVIADEMYGDFVKADIDVARGILLIDMELHADGEAYLLQQGSQQADLWGINLYPEYFDSDGFIEFDSMINIRPRQNNPSRDVLDSVLRAKIIFLVREKVHA